MNKRIMICGASGTGKTTIAKHISELYGLPFVSTSASELWYKFGFDNHKDALAKSIEDPIMGMKYQMEILYKRMAILSRLTNGYITDRSFIDNAAYMIMNLSPFISQCDTDALLGECTKGLEFADGLIFIRTNDDMVLENDGKRVCNKYYQEMTDSVIYYILTAGLVKQGATKILELQQWDIDTRVKEVDTWIKSL